MAPALPTEEFTAQDRPLVSVIIPTYNRGGTIGATLESALCQTYDALEVVVVDDGSTDNTRDVLRQFPSSIISIHQENSGAGAARNTGIKASHGSIIMFLDSDDLWFPHTVEAQVAVLESAGPEVPCVMCDLIMTSPFAVDVTMFADRKLRPPCSQGLWINVPQILSTRFLFTNQTLAIRREALEEVGYFDESLWVMEDFDLAMRLSNLGPWAYTTQTLAIRQDGTSGSLSAAAQDDPRRLNQNMLATYEKIQNQSRATSRVTRFAMWHNARKASRGIRLAEPCPMPTRMLLRAQALVEEGVVERAYRNSWLFPRLRSRPIRQFPLV